MKIHISEVTISADNASSLRLSLAIEKDYLILSQDAMEVEINPDELDIIAAQGKMLLRQFQEAQPVKNDNDGESPRSSMEFRDYLDSIKVYGSASLAPPAPSGLLVERIRDELGRDETVSASAVLHLIAKWLDGQIEIGAAHLLRQEAER